jgi:hypothetical protein
MTSTSANIEISAAKLRRHQLMLLPGKSAAYALISKVERLPNKVLNADDICVTVYENGVPGHSPMYVYLPSDRVQVCLMVAEFPEGARPSVTEVEWPPRCIDSPSKKVGDRIRHLDHNPNHDPEYRVTDYDTGTGRIADYLPEQDRYSIDWDQDAPSKPNPVAWSEIVGCEDPQYGNEGI